MSLEMVKNCMTMLGDGRTPAKDRARFLCSLMQNVGPAPVVDSLVQVIEHADKAAELEKQNAKMKAILEELEGKKGQSLQPEIYLGPAVAVGAEKEECPMAIVLCQSGPMLCPSDIKTEELRCGDFVFLDRVTGKIVSRDGMIVPTGEIARVEKVPESRGGLLTVSVRDQRYLAHVSDRASESGALRPGADVVYDPLRHFVHAVLPPAVDGSDILTPASEFANFTIDQLGSPHPEIWKIFQLVKLCVCHPEWQQSMKVRSRRSFLFWGPSGVGKTCHIKALTNMVASWFEELTGVRDPRLVIADASSFYSPYLGEAEQRIVSWFKKLAAVARRPVTAKDGRKVVPCTLVLLEEVDHLLRQRGEHAGSAHLFDRLLSLILQQMDSVRKDLDAPILFICTTNRKDLLDPAARRRFAEREVYFPSLDAPAALSVLEKKVPVGVPLRASRAATGADARRRLLRSVLHYLYAESDDQPLAQITLRDSHTITLHRREIVTGSMIEAAVSRAIDDCMYESEAAGSLLGLETEAVISALSEQFDAIASGLRPHNVGDYAPQLFPDAIPPASVRSLRATSRLPTSSYVSS